MKKLTSVLIGLSLFLTSASYSQNSTPSAPAISPQEQALLSQLESLVLPEKIGLWPLAPSIWIAVIAVLILISTLGYWVLSARKKKAYRKTAQKERLNIIKTYEKQRKSLQGDALLKLQQSTSKELLSLLKKTYFTAYTNNRSLVAGRYGTEFITLLRENLQNKHKEQPWSKVHIDNDALYRPATTINKQEAQDNFTRMIEHINTFAKHWIEQHMSSEHLRKNTKLSLKNPNGAKNNV